MPMMSFWQKPRLSSVAWGHRRVYAEIPRTFWRISPNRIPSSESRSACRRYDLALGLVAFAPWIAQRIPGRFDLLERNGFYSEDRDNPCAQWLASETSLSTTTANWTCTSSERHQDRLPTCAGSPPWPSKRVISKVEDATSRTLHGRNRDPKRHLPPHDPSAALDAGDASLAPGPAISEAGVRHRHLTHRRRSPAPCRPVCSCMETNPSGLSPLGVCRPFNAAGILT